MEHVYGWLSLLPPIIAVGLALATKEVFGSLIIGIFSGYFIYVNFASAEIAANLASTNPVIGPILEMVNSIIENAGDSWNMAILIFLALLGGLVAVITVAGGSAAYGEWATKKVKSRIGAQIAVFILGCIIFIDDYFNSLTVGTVMRPLTDRYNISRAKLAYILDSTAAPVTILVPLSSWVAYIISIMEPTLRGAGFEMNGLNGFIATIPFNIYAWLSLLMVVLVAALNIEFGPMADFEARAMETGEIQADQGSTPPVDDFSSLDISSKGTPWDLIVPIAGLITFTLIAMIYTGGYFNGEVTLWQALGDTDAAISLVYGGIGALFLCMIMFVPRGLMTYGNFMNAFIQGVKSMVPAFSILILAWTFGSVLRDDGLQTGTFVATIVGNNLPIAILPAIIFIAAGFIAFSTGTSWGTFAIMLPIAISISANVNPEMVGLMMSSVLAGAVFGDHCSPISDTTILSSTGAGCHHIDHVSTQIPYAATVAGVSFIGFIVAGFTNNAIISLIVSIGLLLTIVLLLSKHYKKENALDKRA
ncbi:Na+/H+ antiporter NhaC family protein [Natronincola ferrireducens]|uniref:Transporter, NhaC family (TC 2.A.35) n=1 Tax=Natronincola ferrireducens TaxID=393762 RepID=A0A1G8Y807_9FIRM|nr:Na+/H+ antiporter NhaC family protein [Natronincola ferrireducens]SDJ98851.1 transporter, NhaC family (TC 2.A.35) [Natronincola ferrireducens]